MIEELKKTFDTFNKKMSLWEIQHKKREENFIRINRLNTQ